MLGEYPAMLSCMQLPFPAFMSRRGVRGETPIGFSVYWGACRLHPGKVLRAPLWELPTGVEITDSGSLEPVEPAELKSLSHKTLFLLAISSAKSVWAVFDTDGWWHRGVAVAVNSQTVNPVIEISSFQPELRRRTQAYRHRVQWGCWGLTWHVLSPKGDRTHSCFSVMVVITWAYVCLNSIGHTGWSTPFVMLTVPDYLVTQWNIAASRAALRGVPIAEICAAAATAAWNTLCTFSQFDRVSVVTPEPPGSAVFLPVGWSCGNVESFTTVLVWVI